MEGPSFVQRIGQSMNESVDWMRQEASKSIENIMFDMVANYYDEGVACTRVDCLLAASVEASRVFIMNQQFEQATHPEGSTTHDYGQHPSGEVYPAEGEMHPDEAAAAYAAYADEEYYDEEYVGGPGTYPDENGNFDTTTATTTRPRGRRL
jgi:hypothetical protein